MVNMITFPSKGDICKAKSSQMVDSVGKSLDFKNKLSQAVKQDAKPIEKDTVEEQPQNIDQPKQPSESEMPKELEGEEDLAKASEVIADVLASTAFSVQMLMQAATEQAASPEGEIVQQVASIVQEAEVQAPPNQKGAEAAANMIEQSAVPQAKGESTFVQNALGEMDDLLQAVKQLDVNSGESSVDDSTISQAQASGEYAVQAEGIVAEKNPADSEAQANNSGTTPENEAFAQISTMPANNSQPKAEMPLLKQEPVVVDMTASPKEIQTKLVESITSAINQKFDELTINFTPEVLGGMTVKLTMAADGLHAQLIANTKDATNMIRSEIMSLQDAFRDRGIPVAQIEISIDQHSMSDLAQQPFFGQFHQGRGGNSSQNNSGSARHYNQLTDNDAIIETTYAQNAYFASESNGSDYFA